ncbi:conserved hypothetical protein [Neospora caninum Liverpool]|uniref:Uncharacterized protein n=1 Tax=Neospora caninum (strain Liverpool) TaxID=572307 RepID=F0VP75_NEOCL|nr:conserved hypothetical protein [Neospora caninum Liverpool]CBZ55521.1 conserved hypothetical protein [Neospora caninum Liverpool]CEL70259.1 TPA: hypothetical protein BN1204_059460 [Neospora caninum Liverpool]|eukprot:XP_003885549.1 conserved hypothetical protein [Neospora caninum Liverpool]
MEKRLGRELLEPRGGSLGTLGAGDQVKRHRSPRRSDVPAETERRHVEQNLDSNEDEVMFVRAVDLDVVEIPASNSRSPQKKKVRQKPSGGAPRHAPLDSATQLGETKRPQTSLLASAGPGRAISAPAEGLALIFCSSVNQIELVFGERQGDILFFYRGRPISTVWVQGFVVSVDERAGLFSVDDGTRVLEGTVDAFPASRQLLHTRVRSEGETPPKPSEPEVVIVDDDEQNEDGGAACLESPARFRDGGENERNADLGSAAGVAWREARGGLVSLDRTRKFSLRGTLAELRKAQLEGAYVSLLLQLVPVTVDSDVILSFHLLRVSDCPNSCANAEAEWLTHVLRWRLGVGRRAPGHA